jgi:adenylate kinase|tara:strand:+ start:924 stop:1568 length:645 start_codon:yes stop_codon:yes gene_type:complete
MWSKLIQWVLDIFANPNSKSSNSMMNIILFGPPGSGKGTQANSIAKKYNLLHISTGDLFRYEIGNSTELGQLAKSYINKGELVPDDVTIGMLKNKVDAYPDVAGYIFDGFPRNVYQSEELDRFLDKKGQTVNALLQLDVDDEEIVKRILNRGKTSGREDDNDEMIIRNRISIFNDETSPVYNYYDKSGKSTSINGIGSLEEIFSRLSVAIDAAK